MLSWPVGQAVNFDDSWHPVFQPICSNNKKIVDFRHSSCHLNLNDIQKDSLFKFPHNNIA